MSNSPKEFWRDGRTFRYRAQWNCDKVAGSAWNCFISPQAGDEFELEYIAIDAFDYTAATTLLIALHDGTQITARLMYDSSYDNENIVYPNDSLLIASPSAAYLSVFKAANNLILSGTDRILIQVGGMAQNEKVTFGIRCRCRMRAPTITVSESADFTETQSYIGFD